MHQSRFASTKWSLVWLSIALSGAAYVFAAPKLAVKPAPVPKPTPSSTIEDSFDGGISILSSKYHNDEEGTAAPSGTPTPTPKPRVDQNSFIEGRVSDARTKAPLAGVALSFENTQDNSFEVRTGADGRYRLGHVTPSGRNYNWSAEVAGYSGRSTYVIGQTDKEIRVPKTGLKFDIGLVRAGALRGLVRDIAGRPVARARVLLSNQRYAQERLDTDATGHFESHKISVSPAPNGEIFDVIAVDSNLSQAQAKVRVRPFYHLGDTAQVRLTMKPRATISGQITLGDKPLRDANVSVFPADGTSNYDNVDSDSASEAVTDKNGRYSFKASAPAKYTVSVYAEDTELQTAPVVVSPGRGSAVNLAMRPSPYGSLRGRLVDLAGRPIAGANIELWTEEMSEATPIATTDKRGRFFISKVVPYDSYSVRFGWPTGGNLTKVESVNVRSYRTTQVFARADAIPPRLRVLTPIPSVISAGLISFRLRASDNRGVSYAHMEVDNQWPSDTDSIADFPPDNRKAPRHAEGVIHWDARGVANGNHTLKIVVTDAAGNQTSRNFKVRVKGSPFKAPPKPHFDQDASE